MRLDRRKAGASPSEIFYEITTLYPAHDLPVNEKVVLFRTLLKCLTREERMDLCRLFIQEQVLDQLIDSIVGERLRRSRHKLILDISRSIWYHSRRKFQVKACEERGMT